MQNAERRIGSDDCLLKCRAWFTTPDNFRRGETTSYIFNLVREFREPAARNRVVTRASGPCGFCGDGLMHFSSVPSHRHGPEARVTNGTGPSLNGTGPQPALASASIALCTYNGERFLEAQLQSLVAQTRHPTELVVFDDGSTDRTVQILESFVQSSPFPVRLHRNPSRLGASANFAAAVAACTGDVIFFCDQDDLWEPDKIEVMMSAFTQSPPPAFVFSDADMCDQTGRSLGYRLWSSVGLVGRLRRQFEAGGALRVLLRQNVVTGATLAFDARYRPLILPIDRQWMHDGWTALLLSAVAGARAVDRPLVRYRQHADQSIGAARRSLYQQYLNAKAMDRAVFAEQANQFEAALARLQEQTDYQVSSVVIAELQQKIRHSRRRSAIRQRQIGRILPALAELFSLRYRRYSLGWKSFAQDLLL